ncbi:hypothetical protein TNCV_1852371 [Trichonephila clavipes]|nr:hypothetical protein TNCV_1852371 [Trichonephila clavipes]
MCVYVENDGIGERNFSSAVKELILTQAHGGTVLIVMNCSNVRRASLTVLLKRCLKDLTPASQSPPKLGNLGGINFQERNKFSPTPRQRSRAEEREERGLLADIMAFSPSVLLGINGCLHGLPLFLRGTTGDWVSVPFRKGV